MSNFQQELGTVMGTIVESLIIDVLAHTITFTTKYTRGHVEVRKTIVFSGVAAYYFQSDRGDNRRNLFPPEEGNILEIMEILYYPDKGLGTIGFISTEDKFAKDWAPEYRTTINFLVEMLDDCLFVEADCITIDGKRFYVGYPSDGGE